MNMKEENITPLVLKNWNNKENTHLTGNQSFLNKLNKESEEENELKI